MRAIARVTVGLVLTGGVLLATAQTPPMQADIPQFEPPTADFDYVKREVMIPMRDGVKLYTVIVIPKGAKNAPIILTRTPYNAAKRTERIVSPHVLSTLPQGDEVFAAEGYIRVYPGRARQVRLRGRVRDDAPAARAAQPHRRRSLHRRLRHHRLAGEERARVQRPGRHDRLLVRGLHRASWRCVNPHPALKVAAPESPMVDGWMGDDWFHYGAFRQTNFDYFYGQTTRHGRRRRDRARGVRRLPATSSSRLGRRLRARARPRAASLLAQARRSTRPTTRSGRTRRSTRSSPKQPLNVPTMWRAGPVGPGRHVGRASTATWRPSPRTAATTRTSSSWARGATAGQLRRQQPRAAEVGRRHRAAVPPRRACSRSSTST